MRKRKGREEKEDYEYMGKRRRRSKTTVMSNNCENCEKEER